MLIISLIFYFEGIEYTEIQKELRITFQHTGAFQWVFPWTLHVQYCFEIHEDCLAAHEYFPEVVAISTNLRSTVKLRSTDGHMLQRLLKMFLSDPFLHIGANNYSA